MYMQPMVHAAKWRNICQLNVLGCRSNPLNIFAAHEIAGFCDPSMATKMTVQFNLFGGEEHVTRKLLAPHLPG